MRYDDKRYANERVMGVYMDAMRLWIGGGIIISWDECKCEWVEYSTSEERPCAYVTCLWICLFQS
jgi:hypothetical protein